MSLPLIIMVPADTTSTQWDQIHRAMAEHRAASGNADVVSSFPPPPPPPPVVPTAPEPSLLDVLTAQAAPTLDPTPPAVEPTGDPAWLQGFVMANNALPKADDENWFHILADEAVQASSKGTAHEDTVLKLRRQAAAGKARWSKAQKANGTAAPAVAQPAVARMGGLADLLGTPVVPTAPAVPAVQPAPAVIVNLPSQLTDVQRAAVLAFQDNLVDGTKQAYLAAWLDGKPNPVTGQAITLDDFTATGDARATEVVTKVRRKVKAAG